MRLSKRLLAAAGVALVALVAFPPTALGGVLSSDSSAHDAVLLGD